MKRNETKIKWTRKKNYRIRTAEVKFEISLKYLKSHLQFTSLLFYFNSSIVSSNFISFKTNNRIVLKHLGRSLCSNTTIVFILMLLMMSLLEMEFKGLKGHNKALLCAIALCNNQVGKNIFKQIIGK